MQHALLGLAIAVIVAIAAALAAPAYVDWSDWRANFERHASSLIGAPVRIRGNIEATLLPTPAFVFRKVEIGGARNGAGAEIAEVRGVLSLGALMRGQLEAEEFVLVRPDLRIAADALDGATARSARKALLATGVVALARVSIERGSLTVERGDGTTVFDDIYADGEMRSRHGPLRVDGVFRRDGRRWSLRASTGQFSEASGRLRVVLEQTAAGRRFEADGQLLVGGPSPRFEGKVIAAHRPVADTANGTGWQISANAKAENRVVLDGIQLSLGRDASPTDLAGEVEFEPWPGGRIEADLSARRIDLDLAAGGEAARGLRGALAPLYEIVALLDGLPLHGKVDFATEAVVAAGGTMRDFRAGLRLREDVLALERLEATVPGRGRVRIVGEASDGARFAGIAELAAEDFAAFARWAFGAATTSLRESGALRLAGKLDWRAGRVRFSDMELALGEAQLGGSAAIAPGSGEEPPRIDADLVANGVDLDLLQPVAGWVYGEFPAAELSLALRGNALRVLGRSVGRVDAALSRTSGGLSVERLAVEDFEGLSMHASGRIGAPIERPSGMIEFDLATTRPDGLAGIVREAFGAEAAALVRHVAGSGSPLKLAGTATGAGSAAGIEVAAAGTLGDFDATLALNYDLLTQSLAEGHAALEARNPGALAVLFGLSPGLPAAGNGIFTIDLSKPEEGALPLRAQLSVPGAEIVAEGHVESKDGGRLDPKLNVKVEASDLRTLLAAVARTNGHAPIAAEGGWRFGRDGDGFQFDDIALMLGGTEVKGALTASALTRPILSGRLSIARMELATLLAAAIGHANDGEGFWPAERLGPALLANATGAVDFDVDGLSLPGSLVATGTKFRLRLGSSTAAVEEFSGELAGGRLAGQLNFVRGQTLAFDGRGSFEGFDVARLIDGDENRSALRGRGRMTLSLAGNGATPAALAASLAGQGTIGLERFEIAGADPGAVAEVFAQDEKSEPRDEIAVIAALSPALAGAPLKIGEIEAPIVIAGGNARVVEARSQVGETQVSVEASVDIARLSLDAELEMEVEAGGKRPGATIRWSGPLGAVERGIEAAALANAITLRAMERETRRIEERDRALPPRVDAAPEAQNPVASIPPVRAPEPPPANSPVLVPPDPLAPPITIAPPSAPSPSSARVPRSALPPLPPPFEIRPLPPVYRPDSN